jgi:hypothetical protein
MFAQSFTYANLALNPDNLSNQVRPGIQVEFDNNYEASFPRQLSMSAARWTRSYWRNVGYNLTRMLIVIAVALLFSLNVYDMRMSEVTEQPQVPNPLLTLNPQNLMRWTLACRVWVL